MSPRFTLRTWGHPLYSTAFSWSTRSSEYARISFSLLHGGLGTVFRQPPVLRRIRCPPICSRQPSAFGHFVPRDYSSGMTAHCCTVARAFANFLRETRRLPRSGSSNVTKLLG